MTYQQIVIIPQNNSSDPFADVDTYSCDLHTHVEIVSKKESETTEIIGAYKNGVRVPDSEAESFLDGFSHDYNYYMLAGYEYDKYNLDHYLEPSALTYEEAIAFLNGEIVANNPYGVFSPLSPSKIIVRIQRSHCLS